MKCANNAISDAMRAVHLVLTVLLPIGCVPFCAHRSVAMALCLRHPRHRRLYLLQHRPLQHRPQQHQPQHHYSPSNPPLQLLLLPQLSGRPLRLPRTPRTHQVPMKVVPLSNHLRLPSRKRSIFNTSYCCTTWKMKYSGRLTLLYGQMPKTLRFAMRLSSNLPSRHPT